MLSTAKTALVYAIVGILAALAYKCTVNYLDSRKTYGSRKADGAGQPRPMPTAE
jgi:hypothetical protein